MDASIVKDIISSNNILMPISESRLGLINMDIYNAAIGMTELHKSQHHNNSQSCENLRNCEPTDFHLEVVSETCTSIEEESVNEITKISSNLVLKNSKINYNRLIQSQSYVGGDSEGEMERQYISFDDDQIITSVKVENKETRNQQEVEIESVFVENVSKNESKNRKHATKKTKSQTIVNGKPQKSSVEKSVVKFLKSNKSSVSKPKFCNKPTQNASLKLVEPSYPSKIPGGIRVRRQPNSLNSNESVRLSFKDSTPLRCVLCSEDCINRRALILHVKSHSKDKKSFECPTCKKVFSQQCNLKRHIRCHSKERPYTCPFCKKQFADQGYLTTHLRYHTNTKPYTCNHCCKAFFDRSNYIKHLKSHSGEKNYPCRLCNKSFLQQSDLTRHYRVHSGERPFKCNYCERSFTQHGDLTTHQRQHTGERPFFCTICKKTFANKRYLNSHVKGQICLKRPLPKKKGQVENIAVDKHEEVTGELQEGF